MDDLISRQAAIEALARMMPRSYTPDGSHPADEEIFMAQEVFADCIEALEILPPAQPERPKGHWIVWGGMDIPENHGRHKCSLCGEFAPVRYEKPLIKEYLSDFCPSCGADMRKENES